jgi:hypothetical protein
VNAKNEPVGLVDSQDLPKLNQIFLARPEIVTRAAKQSAKPVFWQIVNQRQAGVGFNGKAAIGHGEETAGATRHISAMNLFCCAREPACSSTALL